jgi:hypothetical protein
MIRPCAAENSRDLSWQAVDLSRIRTLAMLGHPHWFPRASPDVGHRHVLIGEAPNFMVFHFVLAILVVFKIPRTSSTLSTTANVPGEGVERLMASEFTIKRYESILQAKTGIKY